MELQGNTVVLTWNDKKYNANAYGSKLLNQILGTALFDFPKSVYTVMDCIEAVLAGDTGKARRGVCSRC